MKARFAYIPALVVLLLLCIAGAGTVLYFGVQELQKVGKKVSSKQNYQEALQRLQQQQQALANSQNDDKIYGGYFKVWEKKERIDSTTALTERLQKIADTVGVVVSSKEEGASSNVAAAVNPAAARAAARGARTSLPRSGVGRVPGMEEGGAVGMGRETFPGGSSGVLSAELTVVGTFPRLLEYLAAAEGELSSLRVLSTRWVAKSVEEVELTVNIQYRPIRKELL